MTRIGSLFMSGVTLVLVTGAVACASTHAPQASWEPVIEGVWRSRGFPAAYALVEGDAALIFGAPWGAKLDALKEIGARHVEGVLITHHHRDSSFRAAEFMKEGVPVRAPKASAPWLTPEGVRKFWERSLPRPPSERKPEDRIYSFPVWEYLVHPEGMVGIDCSLEDGQTIEWKGWSIQVLSTPGLSSDHTAYAARKRKATLEPKATMIVFCGDAIAGSGTMWSPYSTDWSHYLDRGQQKA